jgi:FBP C-terminal treble-clef zinc-finger
VRRGFLKTTVCSICVTAHPGSGVSLLVAPRAGAAGRAGNTVGTYMCADLACSLYVRGLKASEIGGRFESLTDAERIARAAANLDGFVRQVLGDR